jgi:hypothetical protein
MSDQQSDNEANVPDIRLQHVELPRDAAGLSRIVLNEVVAGPSAPNLPKRLGDVSRVVILACTALGAILAVVVSYLAAPDDGGRGMGRARLFFALIGGCLGFSVGLCIHFVISVAYMAMNAGKYAAGITCPQCTKKVQIPQEFAGKRVTCPLCRGGFEAPAGDPQEQDEPR